MTKKVRSIDFVFRVEQFGSDVCAVRKELGYSQDVVGNEIGLNGSWVSTIENGQETNMKMQHFLALCNAFDLNPLNYFELKS